MDRFGDLGAAIGVLSGIGVGVGVLTALSEEYSFTISLKLTGTPRTPAP
jgi:hypothetical protein